VINPTRIRIDLICFCLRGAIAAPAGRETACPVTGTPGAAAVPEGCDWVGDGGMGGTLTLCAALGFSASWLGKLEFCGCAGVAPCPELDAGTSLAWAKAIDDEDHRAILIIETHVFTASRFTQPPLFCGKRDVEEKPVEHYSDKVSVLLGEIW